MPSERYILAPPIRWTSPSNSVKAADPLSIGLEGKTVLNFCKINGKRVSIYKEILVFYIFRVMVYKIREGYLFVLFCIAKKYRT